MFEFLKGKNNHFLGIDFGTSALKVVELSLQKNRVRLENYGWADFGFLAKNNQSFQTQEEKIKVYLKKLLEKMKSKPKSAYVSIPGFVGLISLIDFPLMKREEISQAINFEAHRIVPTSLKDVSIGWDIIDQLTDNSKGKNEWFLA